jgi:tRNA A-37 threonylcarbamoyl transferase component Bud32
MSSSRHSVHKYNLRWQRIRPFLSVSRFHAGIDMDRDFHSIFEYPYATETGALMKNVVRLRSPRYNHPGLMSEAEFIHEINQNQRIVRFLQKYPSKPFIVPKLHKCGIVHTSEDSTYALISMDFLWGETLGWRYDLSRLPWQRATIGKIFGRTIGWMHAHGIVHGDIHMNNVIIIQRGNAPLSQTKLAIIDWSRSHLTSDRGYSEQMWHIARNYDLVQSSHPSDRPYTTAFVEAYNSQMTSKPYLRIDRQYVIAQDRHDRSIFLQTLKHRRDVRSRSITRSRSGMRSRRTTTSKSSRSSTPSFF